jgi:hypothetical protein
VGNSPSTRRSIFLPELVVGPANEDVNAVRPACDRRRPAENGGTKILNRKPLRSVVRPMQHRLAGTSEEDVKPVDAPSGHARSGVEVAAKIIPVAPLGDRLRRRGEKQSAVAARTDLPAALSPEHRAARSRAGRFP